MTIFGVGPKIVSPGVIIFGIGIYLQYGLNVSVNYLTQNPAMPAAAGTIMLGIGLYFWISAAKLIVRQYAAGKLITAGVYNRCRNPMYAGFILFIFPGVSLIFNNLLLLAPSIVMYAIFRLKVAVEERYLQEKFGDEFTAYRNRVPGFFPRFGK